MSVNATRKQLQDIKEIEHKMQSRVRYLSKEEQRMTAKIALMRQKLGSRQSLCEERDAEMERI